MQLIHTPIQPDLKEATQDLAAGVDAGQIIGLGIIVVMRDRRFFVDCFGSLIHDPHAARGYVASLDDCLKDIGHRQKDVNTMV